MATSRGARNDSEKAAETHSGSGGETSSSITRRSGGEKEGGEKEGGEKDGNPKDEASKGIKRGKNEEAQKQTASADQAETGSSKEDRANFKAPTDQELERVQTIWEHELKACYFEREHVVDYLQSEAGKKLNGKKCVVVGWDTEVGGRIFCRFQSADLDATNSSVAGGGVVTKRLKKQNLLSLADWKAKVERQTKLERRASKAAASLATMNLTTNPKMTVGGLMWIVRHTLSRFRAENPRRDEKYRLRMLQALETILAEGLESETGVFELLEAAKKKGRFPQRIKCGEMADLMQDLSADGGEKAAKCMQKVADRMDINASKTTNCTKSIKFSEKPLNDVDVQGDEMVRILQALKPACVGDGTVEFSRIANGLTSGRRNSKKHSVEDLHLRVAEFVKSGLCEICQAKFFAVPEDEEDCDGGGEDGF